MPNLHLRDGEIGIAHLSDLHFGVGGDKDVWKLLGQILQEVRPELLLVSGDLADTPSQTLFEAARDGLDGFKVPYRVCLGNHDRFIKGIRLKSWQEPLVSPKAPYLVLAIWLAIALGLTIVWPAWYWAVGAVVVVGLGWLARMELFRRLNIPQDYASFHDTFHGTCLKHDAAEPVTVGGWQLGLLGVDSCTRADFYARGYVPATVFQPLRNATRGKQFDLCICLVHHHLLSVRKLEHERQNNPADLKNTTGMVNAGCLLEALAAAHVDLVLHGHEHRDNWASYGSLDGGSGAVRVVAAGSATGAHNIKGWSQSEMTFNLLILRPDRTVRLRRYYYQTNEWKRDPDVPLFDAAHLRHARLRRQMAASGLGGEVVCGITKYVEFTRERDIWVYWYYTDWQLPGREFVQPIRNSTGAPGDVGIDVYWAGNPEPYVASAVSCKRVTGKYDTWEIRWPIPDVIPRDTPVRLVLTYCWRGGGLLTAEELAEAKKHRPLGPLRDDGFEFVVSRTLFPVAYLETVVTLPQEYSPVVKPEIIVGNPTAGVTADDGGENSGAGEPGELARRVTELAPGQFSFQIPYPRPGVDYQIAWKPVTEATLDENTGNAAPRAAFAEAAQKPGAALLAAFGGPLLSRQPKGRWSIGLYLHNPQTATFKPLAVQPLGMDQLPSPLQPPAYDLTTCPVALATAWWGQDAMFRRPNGENAEERAKQLGFLDDELGLICLPVRFALRAVNPPPWGMVRAAALNPEAMTLLDPMNKDILGRALSAGMTALIAKGLAEA